MAVLNDDELENVSGGASEVYDMESDPLYQRFTAYWKERGNEKSDGMGSRAEFINAIHKWEKDGIPKDIGGWYQIHNGS